MTSDNSESRTHPSLLRRLKEHDDAGAWDEFYWVYNPMVEKWCSKWCKQDADARDCSQEILLKVWRKVPDFEYDRDGSFRSWLRTVAHHCFIDYVRSERKLAVDEAVKLEDVAGAFADDMTKMLDQELLYIAIAQVRRTVSADQWAMFEQVKLQHANVSDVAQRYGRKKTAVTVSNHRIYEQIKEKVLEIERSALLARS